MSALPASAAAGRPGRSDLREVERRHVEEVLHQEKGNKVQAARVLGISRRALYRLIEKYGLEGGPRNVKRNHRDTEAQRKPMKNDKPKTKNDSPGEFSWPVSK